MTLDVGFIVSTVGMIFGTVGIIVAGVESNKKNEALENIGHLTLMFGGLVLLYGLSMK